MACPRRSLASDAGSRARVRSAARRAGTPFGGALVPTRRERSAASAPRPARHCSASGGPPSPAARGARVTSRLPRCTRRRTSAFVMPNGGLATTWKSRRGRRRSAASASTTTMSLPSSARRCAALRGCSSTAMTRAPVSTSGRVERARTGPDVDDEIAGTEPGVSDELLRPVGIELMQSPCCPWPGHGCGGPSRSSSNDTLPVLGRASRQF